MIDKIISEISPAYGVCSFEKVKNQLIHCRGEVKIPENAKSVIVMIFPYYFGSEAYTDSDISKYACVRDYHIVANALMEKAATELKEVYPDNSFVTFSDNSPIPEVSAAVFAGLGVKGRNGLLINEKYGSYVFIGEIVTDLELPTTENGKTECSGCNLCVKSCPVNAISENGIDKTLCLSAVTQTKKDLTAEQEDSIRKSQCLWGCDICQDVCPMNRNVTVSPISLFKDGFETKMRTDGDISDRAYAWRGKKVIERNKAILHN